MAQIKLRRDTYQNWFDADPILASGEPAYDTTNKKLKIGDGTTTWKLLPYFDDQELVLSSVAQDIVPDADNSRNLGSPDKQWRDVFVSTGSIYLGNLKLSNQAGQLSVQQVTDAGLETEAPLPDAPGAVTTDRLVNGTSTVTLPAATGTVVVTAGANTVTGVLTGMLTFDPTNVPANSSSVKTVTAIGLTTNHKVVLTSNTAFNNPLVIQSAWASSADTISIEFRNNTNQDFNPGNVSLAYFAWI